MAQELQGTFQEKELGLKESLNGEEGKVRQLGTYLFLSHSDTSDQIHGVSGDLGVCQEEFHWGEGFQVLHLAAHIGNGSS